MTLIKNFKVSDDEEKNASDEDSSDDESSDDEPSSSDDEHRWKQSVKDQYKQIQKEKREKQASKARSQISTTKSDLAKQPKFFELKDGQEYFKSSGKTTKGNVTKGIMRTEKLKKLPLMSRLEREQVNEVSSAARQDTAMVFRSDSFGNKQMTFVSRREKRERDAQKKALEHHLERKGIRRSAGKIIKTLQKPNTKFFKKNK